MGKRPLVSVIIPNYNYGKFLEKTINSVLDQTYSQIEILVIDNGSTDNSLEIISKFKGDIKAILQENRGQSGSRNRGIEESNGSLLAFLDADDYWNKFKIEKQLELIHNQIDFIYSGVRQFDNETGLTIAEFIPKFRGECKDFYIDFPSNSIVPAGESSILITRDLINKIGLFNLNLNSASGRDFFRRCSAKTNFAFVPEICVNYRVHKNNMSTDTMKMIADTEKSYHILFADPEWNFALSKKKKCFRKLYWSFFKNRLKSLDLKNAFSFLLKLMKLAIK